MFELAGEIEVEEQIDSDNKLNMPLLPPKKELQNDVPNEKRALV